MWTLALLVGCGGDGAGDTGGEQVALSCHLEVGPASDFEQCSEYAGLDEAGVKGACDAVSGVVEHQPCSTENLYGKCAMPDGGGIYYYQDSAAEYPDSLCAMLGGTWQPGR